MNQILSNTDLVFVYAFILGLMTAISPCPLATNITAVAFISKDIENKKTVFFNGLIYTLGRAISYTLLGLILFLSASKFEITTFFQTKGEKIIGPVLIIIGLFMLNIFKINFPAFGKITEKFQNNKRKSWLSALLMGIVFALAFCPYSGVLYFGMLIPVTVASASGLYLPIIFAIATGLPVIIFAYLIAFTVSGVGNWFNKITIFQKWFNRVVAIVFIVVGVYYVYMFYLKNLF